MFWTYDKEMQGYETMWCWSSSIEANLCRALLTNTQHEAEIELPANYYVLEKLPWFYLIVMMIIRIDLQLAPLGWWLTTPPAMMQITPPNHGHRWSKKLRCSEIKWWLMKNLPAGSPVACVWCCFTLTAALSILSWGMQRLRIVKTHGSKLPSGSRQVSISPCWEKVVYACKGWLEDCVSSFKRELVWIDK